MTEPQPSPERETLSPALRNELDNVVRWSSEQISKGPHSLQCCCLNCDTHRKDIEAMLLLAKSEGYAEGRQAGAQEERERLNAHQVDRRDERPTLQPTRLDLGL